MLCTCGPAPDDDLPQGGPITLTRDSISLTVDPSYGARLTSLKYGDRELLNVVRDSMGFTYGSTAWPSPQADWNWPPPAALDREPYTVQKVEEHSILLMGQEDSSGLVFQKALPPRPRLRYRTHLLAYLQWRYCPLRRCLGGHATALCRPHRVFLPTPYARKVAMG